ncbi:MAG: hypothetical protein CVT94_07980 [Bacteroidetes bacterium HGW-Bacteroidetes-11]|jgi:hypothetical protein|nr:MAG: hypothetical protein CVT94_07980 [Bacteroidetes bacterium HGW-Bacteroidetes-11]
MEPALILAPDSLPPIYRENLLESMTSTGFKLITSALVMNNHPPPNGHYSATFSQSNLLYVETFTAKDLEVIYSILKENMGLTLYECTALYQANCRKGVLFTENGSLANVARSKGITTLDFLGYLGEMLRRSNLTLPEAVTCYCRIYQTTASLRIINHMIRHFTDNNIISLNRDIDDDL